MVGKSCVRQKPYNAKEQARLARCTKIISILPAGLSKDTIYALLRKYENESITDTVIAQIETDIGRKTVKPSYEYGEIDINDRRGDGFERWEQ